MLNIKKNARLYKILYLIVIIIISSLLLLVSSANDKKTKKNSPVAINGVLDLRNWDFSKDGPIALDGQWEFYYNQLLSPEDFKKQNNFKNIDYINLPGSFNDYNMSGKRLNGIGCATYRLKVLIKPGQNLLGAKTEFIRNAHKLWASDTLVSSNGTVGRRKSESSPQLLPKTGAFSYTGEEFYIILQNSNFIDKEGQIDSILLGSEDQIAGLRAVNLAFDFFILGSTLIAFIYFLGIYLRRKKDKAPLYFALVCFIVGFRSILVGERFFISLFPNFNFIVYEQLLHITFYIYIPILLFFMDKSYEGMISNNMVKLSKFSLWLYIIIIIMSPPRFYNYIIIPFEAFSYIILGYIIYKLLIMFFKDDGYYDLVLLGVFALLASRINDILYEYSIIQTGSYAPLGIFIFIIAQSYVLAEDFSKAFSKQEQLTERLKSVDKLKDDFLAHTSHELKTPLAGIIGLSDSVLSQCKNSLDITQVTNLTLINSSAKRLSNLVNDILDLSKLKNNDIKLSTKPVYLKGLVQMVVKICQSLVGKKPIKIINIVDENLPLVNGDENRLQQILYNLIGNAVKFTPDGTITIGAACYYEFIEVFVQDTGIGIAEDKLTVIFDPYEQAYDFTSEKYGGTGLGLHITKKLVELHGGIIEAESKLGEGSLFTFTLPIFKGNIKNVYESAFSQESTDSMDDNDEASSDTIYSNSFNVLVVDDEWINVKILESIMPADTYKLIRASSGREALSIIEKEKNLDLVILDLMLPDMMGYEVCSLLRDRHSMYELPILVMTADTKPENLTVCFECGANDYLPKPFDKSELLSRIKTLITLKNSVKSAIELQKKVDIANKRVESLNISIEMSEKKVEELMELDKLKSEFMANISHELRTPLNVIWSTLQLLNSLDRTKTIGEAKIMNYFNIMGQNSLRLLRLINNLIDSTRIDNGYLSLNLKNNNIVYVVEEIAQSVAVYIKSQGISLIFDTEIEEKIMAFDMDKLERIVLNILSNAVKFTEEGGTIWINIYDLNDKVRISIKDSGIGIPDDKLEAIFDRFVQVDKSITRNKEGSGIGLSLVKSLVEMHGGIIYATSEIGHGSEFIIELPVVLLDELETLNLDELYNVDSSKYIERINIEFSDIYI